MTVVDTYTMTEAEAHKVTEDIRHSAKSFTEYRVRLMAAVERAKTGNAHIALGYKSWTAYLHEVLGQEPMRLARAEQRDFALMLADQGMGSRAIAPIVGRSDRQIRRDIAGGPNVPPEPTPANVDTDTGEIHDEPVDYAKETSRIINEVQETGKVTGMDGKQYSRPEPQKPRRRPLADQAQEAEWELVKAIERIERIVSDDRFDGNKEVVTPHLRSHLTNAIESCQGLLDRINN